MGGGRRWRGLGLRLRLRFREGGKRLRSAGDRGFRLVWTNAEAGALQTLTRKD